jgi:putative endonuclease
MMFYTYVLISEHDEKFYIDFTKNIEERLDEHNSGSVRSTKHRRPFKLVYYEACLNEKDAIKREKYFKSGFGRRFLNNRIETFLKELK